MTTILLVDDEDFVRLAVRKSLEKHGYHVIEAEDGVRALVELRRNPCDLVITDIVMPDKDGIQLVIEIRKSFPGIPVLVISGGGRTHNLDFLEVAREYGAEASLAKPFDQAALIAAVGRLVSPAPTPKS